MKAIIVDLEIKLIERQANIAETNLDTPQEDVCHKICDEMIFLVL